MTLSQVLFRPQGPYRPSKEYVLEFIQDFMKHDTTDFLESRTEYFECNNDEVVIRGEYHPVPNPKGCVIMAHGFAQNRYILVPQEQIFRKMGFSTVLFDQRAFGESEVEVCTFGVEEAKDVVSLLNYVRENFNESLPILLFGVSMGAATVMNALKYTEDVYALIADSGFQSFQAAVKFLHHSLRLGAWSEHQEKAVERELKKLRITFEDNNPYNVIQDKNLPICILHGTGDEVIPMDHGRALYSVCRHSGSALELFEDKGHALCIMDQKRYEKVLRLFLKELL